jgi:hypothetical protein
MSAAVPLDSGAVTENAGASHARVSVTGVKTFFAVLWTAIGLAIIAGYYASVRLGAPRMHPMEYPFIGAVYLMWVPLVPFLAAMARRYAPVRGRRLRIALIHAAVAVVIILAKLFAHRLVFCNGGGGGSWLDCVLGIRFESWLVHWYLDELLVYAATVGGTWAFDAMRRAEQRELAVAEKERELAAAELQTAHGHIAPRELKALFASISEKLHDDPEGAESMITEVADSLRIAVQAIRAES